MKLIYRIWIGFFFICTTAPPGIGHASLGRGAIRVLEGGEPSPAATFQYGSQKLTLRLKDQIYRRIQAEQKAALTRYGTMGPEYFRDVRAASLKHWLELDRRKIFEETLEKGN